MKISYIFSLLTFICLSESLIAQLTPEQAIAEMSRGINLGNTLEPPVEGGWNNGPAQEAHFDAYLEAGFTNVRIPVRWDEHTGDSAPFAINESWMDRVEEVVDWGLSRGFYITLNGHHEDWLKNNYSNPTLRARYDSIWVQIAERFQNKSDKLLFEIINEPKGMTVAEVDDLNERILGIIRNNNPTRIVIYGGNEWANAEQLLTAAIPDDDYLVGYYHAYDPWQFSGEGNGTWGTSFDYQQLNNKYQSVKNWSEANNIPIYHSEFGAIHACDFNSRMRIYAHNVEQCIVNGFAFSVWDDGGNFGVLNRGNNTWPEVKDILMHYHEDSPNQIFSTASTDSDTNESTIEVTWNNRTTGNGQIILERMAGTSSSFVEMATLPADATAYMDTEVEAGITYTYRMYTTRADGTLLHGYPTRIRITTIVTEQTPFNGSPIPVPGVLEVEEYDNGGEGLAYHDNDAANIPGGFRTDEGVDIGTLGSGFILEYVAAGEWLEYTVDVADHGIYSINATTASEVANGVFSVSFEANGASTSFTVPSTGSWTTFQNIMANSEIELQAGVQQMRLSIDNNNAFNIDRLIFNLQAVDATDIAEATADFDVAPNPSSGLFTVELSSQLTAGTHFEVYNLNGSKVGAYPAQNGANTIDLSTLVSGSYLLKLLGENVCLVKRIVIY
ncbi:MAG: cellulase family glycosylhydrolase [Bacteroidota bacterium]